MGLFDSNTITQGQDTGVDILNAQRMQQAARIGQNSADQEWLRGRGANLGAAFSGAGNDIIQSGNERGGYYDTTGRGATASGLGAQQQAYSDVGNWLNAGPGPSVAQAELRQQNDQNVANTMALANSGRGSAGNAAARNAAMFQNAAAGQQLNQQAATLRAQEAQAWRQQQLQAQGMRADMGSNMAGLGLQQSQLGNQVIGQGQQLGSGLWQTGAEQELNWNQLGQQRSLAEQQLRAQMAQGERARSAQISMANQKDYQTTDAAQLGFFGGLLQGIGGAAGMGAG